MVNDKDIVAWACGNWTNGTYGCTNKY